MPFVKRFQMSLESLKPSSLNISYVVAFSGGVDSHVLLHCCKKLNLKVRTVHVHHGLQDIADEWVNHCQSICDVLNIHLDVLYVDGQKKKGQSPEEAARSARYFALENNLRSGEVLLTAQHLNDQAETLLIQLFRTASTAGLSAMPASKKIGEFFHLRPLLTFSRDEIEAYAKEESLSWVEDPSNQDVSYDRNFIRKNVLPLLQQRWSEITTQLSAVSSLQANNLQVLEDMAAIDLANSIKLLPCKSKVSAYEMVSVLSITRLKQQSSARLLNVLRYWIKTINRLPTRNLLEEIEKTLVNSQQDTSPVIAFYEFEFRKFKDELYLLKTKKDSKQKEFKNDMKWTASSPLKLTDLNIQIKPVLKKGEGLNKSLLTESLTVSFRQGGEVFHPAQRKHSQRLKKLLQEADIPPWDRESIPLLYYNDELVAVVGLWVCKQHSVCADEEGWVIGVEGL